MLVSLIRSQIPCFRCIAVSIAVNSINWKGMVSWIGWCAHAHLCMKHFIAETKSKVSPKILPCLVRIPWWIPKLIKACRPRFGGSPMHVEAGAKMWLKEIEARASIQGNAVFVIYLMWVYTRMWMSPWAALTNTVVLLTFIKALLHISTLHT